MQVMNGFYFGGGGLGGGLGFFKSFTISFFKSFLCLNQWKDEHWPHYSNRKQINASAKKKSKKSKSQINWNKNVYNWCLPRFKLMQFHLKYIHEFKPAYGGHNKCFILRKASHFIVCLLLPWSTLHIHIRI